MPSELPLFQEVFCAKDKKTALEMASPYLLGKYQDYATWGQDKVMPANESFDKDIDELVNDRFGSDHRKSVMSSCARIGKSLASATWY